MALPLWIIAITLIIKFSPLSIIETIIFMIIGGVGLFVLVCIGIMIIQGMIDWINS
jgi:hypothetical protein